jgi:pentatricopeptide repeat protein
VYEEGLGQLGAGRGRYVKEGRYSEQRATEERDYGQRATETRDYGQRTTERRDLGKHSTQGRDSGQRATDGRDSAQPLRPQHLLKELGDVRRPTNRSRPHNQSLSSHSLSPFDIFQDRVANGKLEEAWQTLRHAKDSSSVKLRMTRLNLKGLHQFMRRIVVNYNQASGVYEKGASDSTLPTPWEFLRVVKDLGFLTPALLSELLWRLGNGILIKMHIYGGMDQAARDSAFRELALLWHETLQLKLQPSSSSNSHTETGPLRWNFLPTADSIAREYKGSRTKLVDVLAMIVPTDAPTQSGALGSVADFQSALLVTLDILRSDVAESNSSPSSSMGVRQQWQPLLTFLDDLLKLVAKPKVPPSIQSKLEQSGDPALGCYEALVRRLNLADIPPLRTDRDKAAKDQPRNRIAVLGNRHDAVKRSMKDIQNLGLPETAEVGPAMGLAVALDKKSLTEAGFTVVESMDMDVDVHRHVLDWVKRLGRAMDHTNLLQAEACWKEVGEYSAKQAGASSLPLFLYEHFMLAFLAMRQPRLAMETWNTVIESGLEPTAKTWTVLMRGCSRGNDADALETFWARMRKQGVQPDQHAWSVRLFSLVKAKRISIAFSALKMMGQEWIAAVRKQQKVSLQQASGKPYGIAQLPEIDLAQWNSDIGDVPRPTIAVVNSVISALANKDDQQIPRVLAWAREFAIDFDLTTYNALLNVAMRHDKTAEAFSILKHMQDRAIEPNSTTFTVVLAALFQSDFFTKLSQPEQTTQLFALIHNIEASCKTVKLDAKGYALAIDRMLKLHNNPAAARALLDHMSERRLEPTTHIYTILMTSYFEADPPDFAAAEALWARLRSYNSGYGAALDTIFYDRMVEAYAKNHRHVGIAPMLKFLERMSHEGKRPGWQVLELVARALVDQDEWGRLHGLIDDIRESKGLVRVGVRGLVGQNEFWRFIISTGVLEREGVTSEQELRKGSGNSTFPRLRGDS